MTKRRAWLVIAALTGVLGCGDDDGTGPGPSGAGGLGGSGGQGQAASAGGTAGSGTGSGGSGGGAGNSGSGAAGAGAPGVPADWPDDISDLEACRRYFTAICDRFVACDVFSREECMRRVELCPDRLFAPGSAWTIESARACAPEWASFDCVQMAQLRGPDCDAAPGTHADGATCIFDVQCASGACSSRFLYDETCGVCQSVAQPGGQCAMDVACPRGQECDDTVWLCTDTQITLPEPPPPPRVGLAETCTQLIHCMPGLGCEAPGEGTEQGTCVTLPPIDQPCVETFSSVGLCEDGASCNGRPGGTCIPLGQIGEPCGFSSCVPGAYCNVVGDDFGQSHTCLAPRQAGDPCPREGGFEFASSICAAGLACLWTSDGRTAAFCATPRDVGEPCNDQTELCLAGARCSEGTCVPVESRGLFEAACMP